MRAKPEVGQVVYGKRLHRWSRLDKELAPLEVKKVGRKYFYVGAKNCREWEITKHHIDNWHQASNYTAEIALYSSEQEYMDETRADKLRGEIARYFSKHGRRGLSLRQCEEIAHTLGIVLERD